MPDNPHAFPRPTGYTPADDKGRLAYNDPQYGMTLRDYFAGQVIAALVFEADRKTPVTAQTAGTIGAKSAYIIADAMLAERKRSQT